MASCTYNGSQYPSGAVICISGTEHECLPDGSWSNLGSDCPQGDGIVIRKGDEEPGSRLPAD